MSITSGALHGATVVASATHLAIGLAHVVPRPAAAAPGSAPGTVPAAGEAPGGLAALFVQNRPQLRRIALAIVGNPERADDVMQDAYLKLVAAQVGATVSQPLAYCAQVVRNMARDHHRRCALEAGLLAHEDEGQHVPATQGTPEQLAMRRQDLSILQDALDTAPPRTRVAFEMYFLRGMTQRDIGKALALSVGLVNRLISDATQLLLQHEHLLARV